MNARMNLVFDYSVNITTETKPLEDYSRISKWDD